VPLLLLALPLFVAANGAAPATFYNRPGATQAMLAADLRRCRIITTGPHGGGGQGGRALTPPIPAPGAAAPLSDDARPLSPTIEDCMIARGWRLYALDADARAALEALGLDDRAAALADLMAARCPARATLLRSPSARLRRRRSDVCACRHVYTSICR
jgi:hypothetical protein